MKLARAHPLLGYVLKPAKGGAAGVVIIFSLLIGLCAKSLFGLPLELILLSWLLKYAFILFDNTYRGFDEPPVLDINMMNPFGEMRPIGQLLILAAVGGITFIALAKLGVAAAVLVAAFFLAILPANVAILGLEGDLFKATNPVEWLHVIRGLGTYYVVLIALIALDAAVVWCLGRLPLGIVFQCAVIIFGLLSAFSLLAGALYERRDQLGLVTWTSPERNEELQRREAHRQDETAITEAYRLQRANHHQECWKALQEWLGSQDFHSDAYRWLVGQARRWEDSRYAIRLTEDWVERVMMQKRPGEALKIVIAVLRNDGAFRPKSAAATLSLAQLAAHGGGSPRTARILLSDFASRFPGDAHLDAAAALAKHLS